MPGTNALAREHEAITQRYIPRSDIVLFVTSADRAFTERERAFIEHIGSWGKKLVFVINKADILRSADEVAAIERFVIDNARHLLGFSPEVFSLSSRQALEAKLGGTDDGSALPESGFPALEEYLIATLDQDERVRLKLLNPLGVGLNVAHRYDEAAKGRLDILGADLVALDSIERQLDLYREDLGREFRFRQWQTLNQHVVERKAHHADRVIGSIGSFDQDRRQLLDTVGRAAQRTVDSFDSQAEADRLADSVQNAVAGLAVMEVGAIGLGAIVAALATTTLVDVTGILAASFVAAMGLFILPARRAKAKTELTDKISEKVTQGLDNLRRTLEGNGKLKR